MNFGLRPMPGEGAWAYVIPTVLNSPKKFP